VAGLLFAAAVATLALPTELLFAIGAEHGPLEALQAVLLFALAGGVFVIRRNGESWWSAGSAAFILFAMGARELEWHKAWIGGSVLKPRFYLGPATAGTKVLAGGLVMLLAASAVYLLRRHARDSWNALQRRAPLAITAATFCGALVLSRLADKTHLGHPRSAIVAATLILEEVLELALPVLGLLGAYQYSGARSDSPGRADDLVPVPAWERESR